MLVSPHAGSEVPSAATVYSLACNIVINYTYVDTGTEALVVWMSSDGNIIPEDGRASTSVLQPVDNGYVSIVTFTPLSLTDSGEYICRADIIPDNSSSFVRASSPASDTYTLDAMGRSIISSYTCITMLSSSYPPNSSITAQCISHCCRLETCRRGPPALLQLSISSGYLWFAHCTDS